MSDRAIRFTAVAAIVGLLAAVLVLVILIGRNGIRIETVGEVRITGMPSEIALRMADPVRLTMPEGTTLVGDAGIPVTVTVFPCPTCGSPLIPTRLNLFTGEIEWTCPACNAAKTP